MQQQKCNTAFDPSHLQPRPSKYRVSDHVRLESRSFVRNFISLLHHTMPFVARPPISAAAKAALKAMPQESLEDACKGCEAEHEGDVEEYPKGFDVDLDSELLGTMKDYGRTRLLLYFCAHRELIVGNRPARHLDLQVGLDQGSDGRHGLAGGSRVGGIQAKGCRRAGEAGEQAQAHGERGRGA